MERGKEVCKMLKEIRRQIALENDIVYITTECKHKGNCAGTCPKCEAEVAYLEEQLAARKRLGKTNRVAGIAMGIAATLPAAFASCNTTQGDPVPPEGDPVVPIDSVEQHLTGELAADTTQKINQNTTTNLFEPEPEEFFGEIVEVMPEFPGGVAKLMQYLKDNIRYPKEAKEAQTEGRVIIQFIVEKDGSIKDAEVIKSVDPLLDAEAIRVICGMPKWKPGEQKGKPIRQHFTIPVTFQLNK